MAKDAVYNALIDTNSFINHRSPLVKKIQRILGGDKLVIYTASPFHPVSGIMLQDIPIFEDLLRSVGNSENGVLMINSPGGNGDAAEKILMMCRSRFPASFKVIVPDFAKSAATMIALGSDEILMGYLSELGPIDPQFSTSPMAPGLPARSLIDGLEMIRKKVQEGDPIELYYPMLSQIRPEIIARAQSAIDGSKEFARKWLKQHQLRDNPKQANKVAKWLSEGKRYRSHGKVINYEECKNVLKLNVTSMDKNSDLWNLVWELYCRSIFYLQQTQSQGSAKLFENEKVSMSMNLMVQQVPGAPRKNQPIAIPPLSILEDPDITPLEKKEEDKT